MQDPAKSNSVDEPRRPRVPRRGKTYPQPVSSGPLPPAPAEGGGGKAYNEIMQRGLTGLRVVSFESRRTAEVAELIRNHGGTPMQAPSMREIPLADQHEALAFGDALVGGSFATS